MYCVPFYSTEPTCVDLNEKRGSEMRKKKHIDVLLKALLLVFVCLCVRMCVVSLSIKSVWSPITIVSLCPLPM
jgi:hypothetical protein